MGFWRYLSGFVGSDRIAPPPRGIPIHVRGAGTPAHQGGACLWAVLIVRDEALYLPEWLAFHRVVGVEHVLVYDNGSTDATEDVLSPHVARGFVEHIPWPNFLVGANHQHLCYAHAVRHAAGRCRWLAVLDADEFLFSPGGASVPEVLADYEDLPALGVFLRNFGTSGHVRRPSGPVIANYVHRMPDDAWENQQYKSIVRPDRVRSVISAQRFHTTGSTVPAHDERRRPLVHAVAHDHVSDRLRIHHYATRSHEDLEAKLARRYFGGERTVGKRRAEKRRQHARAAAATIEDRSIQAWLPALNAALAVDGATPDSAA